MFYSVSFLPSPSLTFIMLAFCFQGGVSEQILPWDWRQVFALRLLTSALRF